MNTEAFLTLAKEFIAIVSTEDNKKGLDDAIAFCKKLLEENKDVTIKEFEQNGKKSLIATVGETKTPTVFLNGHVDVIPAPKEMFTLKVDGDKLIGRGAIDMKLQLLIFIKLLATLPEDKKHHVGLMIVSDEEIGGQNGTGFLKDLGYVPSFFLTGEPTLGEVYTQGKGLLWVEITQKGKSAHAAAPWLGNNALISLIDKVNSFVKSKQNNNQEGWQTTYNISKLQGGDSLNSVPDTATVWLDIRPTAQDYEQIMPELKSVFSGCEITLLDNIAPVGNDEKNHYIVSLAHAIEKVSGKKAILGKNLGSTDAHYYSSIGIPAVSFGPLGFDAHSAHEWVSLKSILEYYDILFEFLNRI